ncbi:MAG: dCTP deaminase [Dolichospermum sp.]|nr:dCTP deaminase [Dolichospermum sp.]
MILVDHEIQKLCEAQNLVTPYNPELINPSSLDIRLGNNLIIEVKGDGYFTRFWKKLTGQSHTIIEPSEKFLDISDSTKTNPYILKPKEFVLAETLEYISIPPNMASEFRLKSTKAREGLGHALAVWIDNGFQGVLTLELINYRRFMNLDLYPGLRIGQLFLHQTKTPDNTYKVKGRYAGFKTVVGSLGDVK